MSEESVTIEMILDTIRKNVSTAKEIIRRAAPAISPSRGCRCASALANAVITDKKAIPSKTMKRLELLLGKYAGKGKGGR